MPGTNTVPGITHERHTMRFLQDFIVLLIWCGTICISYYIYQMFV